MAPRDRKLKIVIVGVCTSGKTSVCNTLKELGYDAYTVAQEHSSVPHMWRLRNPDVVVYLYCDLETVRKRRAVYWGRKLFETQLHRLSDARKHSHVFIDTTELQVEDTVQKVLQAIEEGRGFDDHERCDS